MVYSLWHILEFLAHGLMHIMVILKDILGDLGRIFMWLLNYISFDNDDDDVSVSVTVTVTRTG
jgi:hypothetical protein